MHYVVATYRLKPDCLDRAKAAILNYVENVRKTEPNTFMYQCFQSRADSTRFLHLKAFNDEEAELKHTSSSFLQKFSERLFPFCVEGPNYEALCPIGSPACSSCERNKELIGRIVEDSNMRGMEKDDNGRNRS